MIGILGWAGFRLDVGDARRPENEHGKPFTRTSPTARGVGVVRGCASAIQRAISNAQRVLGFRLPHRDPSAFALAAAEGCYFYYSRGRKQTPAPSNFADHLCLAAKALIRRAFFEWSKSWLQPLPQIQSSRSCIQT